MKKIILILLVAFFAISMQSQTIESFSKITNLVDKYELKSLEPYNDSLKVHYTITTYRDTTILLINPNEDCILPKDYAKLESNFIAWIKNNFNIK